MQAAKGHDGQDLRKKMQLVYGSQTDGSGRSPSSDRQPCNRIGMNARTVDQREVGSLFVED